MVSAFHLILCKILFSGLVGGFILFSTAFFGNTSLRAHPKERASFQWYFAFFSLRLLGIRENIINSMTSENCTRTYAPRLSIILGLRPLVSGPYHGLAMREFITDVSKSERQDGHSRSPGSHLRSGITVGGACCWACPFVGFLAPSSRYCYFTHQ